MRNRQFARLRAARLLISLALVLMIFGTGSVFTAGAEEVTEPEPAATEHDHATHDHGVSADSTVNDPVDPDCVATRSLGDACTHGPDVFPASFHSDAPDVAAATNIACVGDGTSGPRVQLIYAYKTGTPNNYNTYINEIRQIAAGMETIYDSSAALTGGSRHVRFVHTNSASCTVSVQTATLSATGISDFGQTIAELENQGFTGSLRRYLVFVDTNTTLCGIGEYFNDDSAGSGNANNNNTLFSRVDRVQPGPGSFDCWTSAVASHELMHNLGGVQNSAPNSTYNKPAGNSGGHCTDEYDIMCYSDFGGGQPAMQIKCAGQALDNSLLDCNNDDYYNTNPAPGSYLATKWNTARSQFLDATAVTNTPPTVVAPKTIIFPSTVVAPSQIPLKISWSATDTDGIGSYGLQMRRNAGAWTNIALSPATATSKVRYLSPGSDYTFRVRATDTLGAVSDWVTGTTFRLRGYQETTPTYTGTWTTTSLAGAWGGNVRHAASNTARATLTFTGSSVGFVSTFGPDRGKADIYLDGLKVKTVDFYSASRVSRKIVYSRANLSAGTHTLQIRVLGQKNTSSSSTRVDVDGFIVLQ